ncbi:hypothetical protein I316_07433 [Kwoniella heveanensis BCC8398]|uniref:Uncharacterized protein n=1 Tax=Kwoniella heveanensis BCC8398 TaxID=1296120 RepID=A0A1B9GIU0_9TREE|nr:hypothetical protein I316_07433 [Kwoniella heveanensis BCC8398]
MSASQSSSGATHPDSSMALASGQRLLQNWAEDFAQSYDSQPNPGQYVWKDPPDYKSYLNIVRSNGNEHSVGVEAGISLKHRGNWVPFVSPDVPWLVECDDNDDPCHKFPEYQDTILSWNDQHQLPTRKFLAAAKTLHDTIVTAEEDLSRRTEGYRTTYDRFAESHGVSSALAKISKARELQSAQTRQMIHDLEHHLFDEMGSLYDCVSSIISDKGEEELNVVEGFIHDDPARADLLGAWQESMEAWTQHRLTEDSVEFNRTIVHMLGSRQPTTLQNDTKTLYLNQMEKAKAASSTGRNKALQLRAAMERDPTTPWSSEPGGSFPETVEELIKTVYEAPLAVTTDTNRLSQTGWEFLQDRSRGDEGTIPVRDSGEARQRLLQAFSRGLARVDGEVKTVLACMPSEERYSVLRGYTGSLISASLSTIQRRSRENGRIAHDHQPFRDIQLTVDDSDVQDIIRSASDGMITHPDQTLSAMPDSELTSALATLGFSLSGGEELSEAAQRDEADEGT